ncbi:hypothetical protein HDK64DRAFT_279759 [Phyllosticta capitalensis]
MRATPFTLFFALGLFFLVEAAPLSHEIMEHHVNLEKRSVICYGGLTNGDYIVCTNGQCIDKNGHPAPRPCTGTNRCLRTVECPTSSKER